MIQNNNSSESTQPNKPITKGKRGKSFLFKALGLIVIFMLAILGGYGSGISIRKETRSSALLQQLGEQYQFALVDMQFGRYENAKQRLEFIIENDPSFPGASDTLTQVLVQMSTQASQPAPTAMPTVTSAPDFSGWKKPTHRHSNSSLHRIGPVRSMRSTKCANLTRITRHHKWMVCITLLCAIMVMI